MRFVLQGGQCSVFLKSGLHLPPAGTEEMLQRHCSFDYLLSLQSECETNVVEPDNAKMKYPQPLNF